MYIPSPDASSHVLERAQSPPSPPGLYDGVHDMYGPGAFIAWIITGYCVAAQYFSPTEGSLYWNMDKDLAVFVLYPVVAAGQLIYKVRHYEGPRINFWDATHAKPGVASIWADSLVCTTALGLNACLAVLLHKSKLRVAFLLAADLWFLIGLLYTWAPCTSFLSMAAWSLSIPTIALMAVVSCFIPPFIPGGLFAWISAAYEQWVEISSEGMGLFWTIGARLVVCLYYPLGLCMMLMFLALPLSYGVLIPHSTHKIGDFGQVMALAAAAINACLSVRALWRDYGKDWVDFTLGRS